MIRADGLAVAIRRMLVSAFDRRIVFVSYVRTEAQNDNFDAGSGFGKKAPEMPGRFSGGPSAKAYDAQSPVATGYYRNTRDKWARVIVAQRVSASVATIQASQRPRRWAGRPLPTNRGNYNLPGK
jgi:hypothetical protein